MLHTDFLRAHTRLYTCCLLCLCDTAAWRINEPPSYALSSTHTECSGACGGCHLSPFMSSLLHSQRTCSWACRPSCRRGRIDRTACSRSAAESRPWSAWLPENNLLLLFCLFTRCVYLKGDLVRLGQRSLADQLHDFGQILFFLKTAQKLDCTCCQNDVKQR